ncbi:MAG: hypothetical protein Q9190_006578 [Brigantiaea leucoxantha]
MSEPPVPLTNHDKTPTASNSSSSSSSDEDTPVETLVFGRVKRATAGNRLSSLLGNEGDDDLELLFAEDEEEEDIEFEDDEGEGASDAQLDSSSDDEDQGHINDNDDMAGEKELQRQVRIERQKKRKAQEVFKRPPTWRKKAKVDPTATVAAPKTPASRLKKKSERVSWLPTPEEGPTRSSSRKQTVQNKEIIHSRMVESEKRRLQQIQVMEAAAKRKEAAKPKVMDQAGRLAEAARTEKTNAKSLNRWEAAEKKRSEEQKAKLEALHNRQLTGPVISWWSGMARWINGKLKQTGWGVIKEIERQPHVQQHEDVKKDPAHQYSAGVGPIDVETRDRVISDELQSKPESTSSNSVQPSNDHAAMSPRPATFASPSGQQTFLDGIHYYASLPDPSQKDDVSTKESNVGHGKNGVLSKPSESPPSLSHSRRLSSSHRQAATQPSSLVEHSSRNLVMFKGVDTEALGTPELQNHVLLKKRIGKAQSKSPTSHNVVQRAL